MSKLDTFTQAYIEAALWASVDEHGAPLADNFGPEDLAPETFREMECDCQAFLETYGDWISEAGISEEQAGHDFWLTRNRHGAGFWDRGLGEIGDKLADAARAFGGVDLLVCDDGKVRA